MNAPHLLALATIGLLSTNFSCKQTDETPCPEGPVTLLPLTNWNYSPYCFATPVVGAQAQTYVINSVADLQALNHCTTAPTIDFSHYTLLAGKTKTAACSSVDSQQVIQTCANGYSTGFTYRVKLAAGACQASTEVMYCVLVPKIPAGTAVVFDVQLP
ncbi:MAG: hypothetical protein EOO62_15170 [Hymenobacter sp.]|nr:MAG: hypothetical protein EOO62_15170 [Hymenobacter sp.]